VITALSSGCAAMRASASVTTSSALSSRAATRAAISVAVIGAVRDGLDLQPRPGDGEAADLDQRARGRVSPKNSWRTGLMSGRSSTSSR
jgi:hypothetical protein